MIDITPFMAGFLIGVGMTVGIFLFLTKMSGVEPWE